MKRIKSWMLVGFVLLGTPTAAFAESCWNYCSIEATNWMNDNNKSIAEAAAYHAGCVNGCENGPPPGG